MSRLLFISNVTNKVSSFVTASISAAHTLNINFYQAANWQNSPKTQISAYEHEYDIKIKSIPIARNPFSIANLMGYKELVNLIKQEKIDYIHCNTPVGGMLGRLAGRKCDVKKVIYQAHGFHFYKGAPVQNWLLYYPVEKWLARYTDALITINREDYELARRKMKLRNGGQVYYVPGVGIDTSKYGIDVALRKNKREELGLNNDDIALISMGDLIKRKNYSNAIRAVAEAKNDKMHYFICGVGSEERTLRSLAKQFNITRQIHFLGYRADIKELLAASDIFLFTSKQEGLSRSMMEAMASGLPCVASRIRGNTDLLENTEGGFLCNPHDVLGFAEKLNLLASNEVLRKNMGRTNLVTIQKFSTESVIREMQNIYATELLVSQ